MQGNMEPLFDSGAMGRPFPLGVVRFLPPTASEQHVHLIALGFVEHLAANEETA